MSIDRRQFIALLTTGAASLLAGCGGGGYHPPPTRFMWLLNLNPEFPGADVSFGATTVSSALPFPALTPRLEVEYGSYTVGLRERSNGFTQNFDAVAIDAQSPSMFVFYRHFASTRLGSAVPGIVNFFDSNIALDVDLFDGVNNVQLETLTFEGSAPQNSRSLNCALRLYAAGSPTLVYDSGLRERTDSILVFPRFPAASPRNGEVAVLGLNFGSGSAAAVNWPNILG
jgi:hypothetical protein